MAASAQLVALSLNTPVLDLSMRTLWL